MDLLRIKPQKTYMMLGLNPGPIQYSYVLKEGFYLANQLNVNWAERMLEMKVLKTNAMRFYYI